MNIFKYIDKNLADGINELGDFILSPDIQLMTLSNFEDLILLIREVYKRDKDYVLSLITIYIQALNFKTDIHDHHITLLKPLLHLMDEPEFRDDILYHFFYFIYLNKNISVDISDQSIVIRSMYSSEILVLKDFVNKDRYYLWYGIRFIELMLTQEYLNNSIENSIKYTNLYYFTEKLLKHDILGYDDTDLLIKPYLFYLYLKFEELNNGNKNIDIFFSENDMKQIIILRNLNLINIDQIKLFLEQQIEIKDIFEFEKDENE